MNYTNFPLLIQYRSPHAQDTRETNYKTKPKEVLTGKPTPTSNNYWNKPDCLRASSSSAMLRSLTDWSTAPRSSTLMYLWIWAIIIKCKILGVQTHILQFQNQQDSIRWWSLFIISHLSRRRHHHRILWSLHRSGALSGRHGRIRHGSRSDGRRRSEKIRLWNEQMLEVHIVWWTVLMRGIVVQKTQIPPDPLN